MRDLGFFSNEDAGSQIVCSRRLREDRSTVIDAAL